MSASFYDGTIVVAQSLLTTLSHILHKAEQHQNDANTLLEARLREDMYPLTDQVRVATQFSENMAARLTGREPVTFERDLTSFAKFYERIETVLKALGDADKNTVNEKADVVGTTQLGAAGTIEQTGAAYAYTIALPNIYFHVSTAYGILRKEGVPLGKRDYISGFFPEAIAGRQ